MAICLVAMLLVGCLSESRTTPTGIDKVPTPSLTLNAPKPFQKTFTPSPIPREPAGPTPTPTATPTTIPPGKIALPYDLLYLSEGQLMRWSHTQNNTRPAVIDVVDYSTSLDGSKIAILRKTGLTANAIETFDLTVLDTKSGDFVTLLDATPRPKLFQISPDGAWVVMMNDLQQLYLLPSDGSNTGANISECHNSTVGDCNDLAWSADSQSVIWDDGEGIWQAGPANRLPTLVITNQIDITDPKGQLVRKQVQFHGLNWSPFGRYVLTRIQPIGSNVSWQAVVDTRLRRMVEIPTSYQLEEPTALTFWLQNGNLVVVHRETELTNQPLALESWQILPTREDLMSLEFRWEIGKDQLVGAGRDGQMDGLPTAPCQLNDRTLSLAWNSEQLDGPGSLFTFELKYGILNKIAEVPDHIVSAFWTPEGDAALVKSSDGSLIFIPADGIGLSDITARFGRQTCCYTWLADGTTLP